MKSGKTTTACKFPKPLLLAFEAGYLAIPGAMALPINKWSEFKQVLRQLKDDKAHDVYENVIIDTADIAYDLCEKYICNKNGVQELGEVPYGGAYSQLSKEFDEALRSIPQMGYGLVIISHSQDKTFKDENGNEYDQIVPTLANRGRLIVERMADIIAYTKPTELEDGSVQTVAYLRGTPRYIAGSRFKYIPDHIIFNYDTLVKAIGDAIDQEANENNNQYVTNDTVNGYEENNTLDFNGLMNEFKYITRTLQKNVDKVEFKNKWAPFIVSLTDKYLGTGKKVNDITEQQVEQLAMIVADLKEAVGNGI